MRKWIKLPRNIEKIKKQKRQWYLKNKKTIRQKQNEYSKKYRKRTENIIKARNTSKIWRQNNPDKRLLQSIRFYNKIKNGNSLVSYKFLLYTWSKAVRKRDDNQCQICGKTNVQSHHIFPKISYPELSLNINNGVTLCVEHHSEITQWGRK